MNKEQLKEAASDYHDEYFFLANPNREAIEEAFKDGARWHESLPLAERLTEEEREKIRSIHKSVVKQYLNKSHISLEGWFYIMEQIFGDNACKELFTDKSE